MSNDPEVSYAARLRQLVGLAMEHLSASRPVFYSEADFQHALAWEIRLLEPDAQLRLETPLLAGGKERLDVFVALGDGRYAIELKYPRATFEATVRGQPVTFKRKNPDADDESRRAIAEDIRRVERLIEEGAADAGCVVVLTNISAMWRDPAPKSSARDLAYRIHEGASLSGALQWGPGGRFTDPVVLASAYPCRWREYSNVPGAKGSGLFRYLTLVSGG